MTYQKSLNEVLRVGVEPVRERVLERLNLLEGQVLRSASERWRASEELEEDAAECPKVGPGELGSGTSEEDDRDG